MATETIVLTATPRDRLGSRYSGRLRQQGRLPAVVYGHKEQPVAVSLDAREASSHIHKGQKVFQLSIEGRSAPETVLLKDVQFDHLGTKIIHCDLARVSMTDRVAVRVPVRLIGEAPGLKTAGAILMHPTGELQVECLVTEIPSQVEVGIETLDVGHAITAAEVKLPKPSMKLLTDPHAILAQIVIQQEIKVEEEVVVDAAAAEGPEVITARKPEEGEEGAEAGKAPAGKDKAAAPAGKEKAPAAKAAPGSKPAPGKDEKKK
jgi:large subunit ribosomal protein L25